MICAPDAYTFKTQYMMGLPSNILRSLVDKGITAETSQLAAIISTAQRVEDGLRVQKRYDEKRRTAGQHAVQTTVLSPRVMTSSSSPVRTTSTRNYGRPKQPTYTSGTSASTQPRPQPVASGSRLQSKPATTAHGNRALPRKEVSRTACFACGKEGHYASDSTCPKYGQPRPAARLHAARTAEDEENLETDEREGIADQVDPLVEEESPLGGEQYSSNDEQQLEDYELFEYIDDDEEERLHVGVGGSAPTGWWVAACLNDLGVRNQNQMGLLHYVAILYTGRC